MIESAFTATKKLPALSGVEVAEPIVPVIAAAADAVPAAAEAVYHANVLNGIMKTFQLRQ